MYSATHSSGVLHQVQPHKIIKVTTQDELSRRPSQDMHFGGEDKTSAESERAGCNQLNLDCSALPWRSFQPSSKSYKETLSYHFPTTGITFPSGRLHKLSGCGVHSNAPAQRWFSTINVGSFSPLRYIAAFKKPHRAGCPRTSE